MNTAWKKSIVFLLISTFWIIPFQSKAFFGGYFGGKIINSKASRIETLENSNYSCAVPGTTIEIQPQKGPKSYLIPKTITSKTKEKIKKGQNIIGTYIGITPIICIYNGYPPSMKLVILPTVKIYGNK